MTKESIEKFKEESRRRIIWLIENKCHGSQKEFCDATKIGKASVSQYVSGFSTPSNIRAAEIGDAFGINPAWVMGFNCSQEISTGEHCNLENQCIRSVMEKYLQLDDADRIRIEERMDMLLEDPKYKKDMKRRAT